MKSQIFNYWSDRVSFKEKIKDELNPKLDKFIGKEFTNDLFERIKNKVLKWIEAYAYGIVFDCNITVDIEKKEDGQDYIKVINIIPID